MSNRWLIVVLGVLLASCGDPSEADRADADMAFAAEAGRAAVPLTPMQAQGRVIYETMCWTCHGLAGRGDGPAVEAGSVPAPPSFHWEEYAQATRGELEHRFDLSGNDPTHPHMQYVSSLLRPERFAEALSYVAALSYPAELPGSAVAGERLYMQRCVGCHGADGRGDGPASASLVLMAPADFTSDTLIAARDWDGVYGRIREGGRPVHGSSMPPWGLVLDDVETWDLVAFLATFQPDVLDAPVWMRVR